MKRISYLRPMLIALIIMSAVACTDNVVTPQFHGTIPLPQERHLVANNWRADGSGSFVSSFGNISGLTNPSHLAVYALKNNVKTLISGGGIDFEGGRLWAQTEQWGNLNIFYKPDSGNSSTPFIPFNSVEIVLVF